MPILVYCIQLPYITTFITFVASVYTSNNLHVCACKFSVPGRTLDQFQQIVHIRYIYLATDCTRTLLSCEIRLGLYGGEDSSRSLPCCEAV
jgi:hypothetical protein